jgi:hypothetical protein
MWVVQKALLQPQLMASMIFMNSTWQHACFAFKVGLLGQNLVLKLCFHQSIIFFFFWGGEYTIIYGGDERNREINIL